MSSYDAKQHTTDMYNIEISLLQHIADAKLQQFNTYTSWAAHFGWFGRTSMKTFLATEKQQADLAQQEVNQVKDELKQAQVEGRAN